MRLQGGGWEEAGASGVPSITPLSKNEGEAGRESIRCYKKRKRKGETAREGGRRCKGDGDEGEKGMNKEIGGRMSAGRRMFV